MPLKHLHNNLRMEEHSHSARELFTGDASFLK